MTFHPAILPFAVSVIVMMSISVYGYLHREFPASKELSQLMLVQALWVIFYIMELVSPELDAKIFWLKVKYLVAPATAVLWLVLCFVLTENRQVLTRTFYVISIGWSASISLIAITNDWHKLFWEEFRLVPGILESVVVHGSLFPFYSIPSLSIVPISLSFFAIHSRKARFYRDRSALLILGGLMPPIAWVTGRLGIGTSLGMDPVVLGLCLATVIYAIAVFQFQVLDVLRVAQRLIINNIDVGMIVVDDNKKLLGINPHAQTIFPSAEVGGQLEGIFPEARDTELKDGDEWEYLVADDAENEAETYYLVRISEVANEQVGKLGHALILWDISESKAAEKASRESMEAKSRFFANVSHELRTPLHGISGLLELLKRTDLDEKQEQYLDKATASARLLLTLINDVLDITRIESERLEFELAPFSLQEVAEGVRSVIGVNAAQKGLDFIVDIDQLDRLLVGDSLRLTQVLTNLTANAVKFTNKGYVKLVARIGKTDDSRATVVFSVSDSGIGIPEHQQHSLFNAFSQIDSSTTRQFGGTGLGLAISQQLVKRMGSKIAVESAEGKGSQFSFALTFSLGEVASFENTIEVVPPSNLEGLRVLVADDSHVNQQVAEELLEQVGVQVQLASNGREAVEAANESRFDAILMDVQMPEMDGHEATRLLRFDYSKEELPIIAMTASAFDEDRQFALEAGMTGFVSKPFQPENLYTALQNCLGKNKTASKLPAFENDGAEQRFNGDKELYKKLLKDLAEEAKSRLIDVGDATSEEQFKRIVHGIKGSAGIVGATELAACASTIEQELCQGLTSIEDGAARLRQSVARLEMVT